MVAADRSDPPPLKKRLIGKSLKINARMIFFFKLFQREVVITLKSHLFDPNNFVTKDSKTSENDG